MKVTLGPTIYRYAACYGCDPVDVLDWINEYIQVPTEHREATEEERRDSITGYVKAMIACSTYGRIKESLDREKVITKLASSNEKLGDGENTS